MAVKPGTIENREQDLAVENRTAPADMSAEEQLHALRQKITAGLNSIGENPRKRDKPSCNDCWNHGWIAAMKSLQKL